MLDKNGIEIKTGDIVKIEGAYFKNDNGFWFVENSAGDLNWSGKDHSLRKISKRGKISRASRNLCFWPIMITTNSWEKRALAKSWNAEHATIEVVNDIDRSEVAAHFREKAESMDERIEYDTWHYGEDNSETVLYKTIKAHYEGIAKRILVES